MTSNESVTPYLLCSLRWRTMEENEGERIETLLKITAKQALRLLPYCYSLGGTRYKLDGEAARGHWNKCLVGAIGGLSLCCKGKQGARALSRSCIVRYEVYPFYQLVSIPLARAGIRFGAVFYIKRQR
ncbi:hypothetical protein CK203_109888 [Vitis vinifera]|uniref:Gnk2-homologous domain-containing protein n=1 Tax=Vitis vinifera TaxID=29760 RepID=A0A438CDB2_VITVI|nr:hypothetical protein CK203_109888 [Vitis vinifera]